MAKRKTYDWEAIEKEFRSGQLSIREIANQHGCSDTAIRKKMKALGVERDLSERVAQKVRTELVRNEVRTANPISEKEIIDTAADRAITIVRSERKKIGKGVEIVETLLDQLAEFAEKREEIEETIGDETAGDDNYVKRQQMLKAVSLPSHASVVVNLSNALKNLVALERQAFSIKDETGKTDKIEGITFTVISPE